MAAALVDTSVVLDLADVHSPWFELSIGFAIETIPKEALFLAGKAFLNYRRKRGGSKSTTLPDFFIGAHAAVNRYSLITRDPKPIRTYFPTVDLVAPA